MYSMKDLHQKVGQEKANEREYSMSNPKRKY
jgi:hypothetical protein